MEFFIDEGPFHSISNNIFGMTQFDHKEKIFAITFKADDASKSAIKKMINTYSQRQPIVPKNGTPIHMWVDEPVPPPATITLYPVPLDIPDEEIEHLVRSQHWGVLRRFKFGSHKEFPQFHNEYLHLQIDKLNEDILPKQIIINCQPVSVSLPGAPIRKCAYCRNFGHLIQNCNKRKNKNPPPSNNKSALPANSTWGRQKPTLNETALPSTIPTEHLSPPEDPPTIEESDAPSSRQTKTDSSADKDQVPTPIVVSDSQDPSTSEESCSSSDFVTVSSLDASDAEKRLKGLEQKLCFTTPPPATSKKNNAKNKQANKPKGKRH